MLSEGWLKGFRDPSAAYRQQMFWIWNGEMSERRITEMMEEFVEQGIGGGFANPRPGRITPYLSERWFELWEHAVREAQRLKLECHILDEDGYPSGAAGGMVLEAEPTAACQYMMPVLHERPPVEVEGRLLAACAYDPAAGTLTHLPPGTDLDAEAARRPVLTIAVGVGEPRTEVDLYRPEVAGAFIRLTHEKYVPHSCGAFGKQTKYVYTEEPAMATRLTLAVSDYLLAEFRKDHGYDLTEKLGVLFTHTPESRAVRYDYFETLDRLWCTNFVQAVDDWCMAHKLEFTGHYWEHEWPEPHGHANSMTTYRHMRAPGVDHLGFQFKQTDRRANSILLLTFKEVGSVANQLGLKRVSSENYGAGGYGMAIRDFKPLSDFGAAYGINLSVPHLTYETLAGRRKYDWPQTISDHSSWWPCYHVVADHDARLTYALCHGRERNRVLLLHPTASGWLHYVPTAVKLGNAGALGDALIRRLRDSQAGLIQNLTDAQVDFDLGDEWLMAEFGSVRGRELRVGRGRYSLVILPPNMETVRESTLELLDRYMAAGGTVLALGKPPALVRGRVSDAPAALARKHPQQWAACASVVEALERVRTAVPPRVSRADGSPLPAELVYRREEMPQGRVLHFFANPWTMPIETSVRLEGKSLLALDTATGESQRQATESVPGGQVVQLFLHPAGHALFVSDPVRRAQPPAPPRKAKGHIRLGRTSVRRAEPNVLVLDYCDLEMDGQLWPSINTARAYSISWDRRDIRTNREYGVVYQHVSGPPPEPAQPPRAPQGGLIVQYRFQAQALDLSSLELALERPWLYRVELNGVPLEFPESGRWFDEDIRRIPIAHAAVHGENVVRLTAEAVSDRCEIAPAYVLGAFALQPAERGFIISDPVPMRMGDWREQGLCFYPWGVCYDTPVTLGAAADGLTVRLPQWVGSAVRVRLDGREVGVIVFPPHEAQVAGPIAAGEHVVSVEVIGNMKNLMGSFFNDWSAGLWSWMDHPLREPPGKRYRFFPCGLMAPMELEAWKLRRR
jgi:hypothetical protein